MRTITSSELAHATRRSFTRGRSTRFPVLAGIQLTCAAAAYDIRNSSRTGGEDIATAVEIVPSGHQISLGIMASEEGATYDRVRERRRAVALARHFREAEGLS